MEQLSASSSVHQLRSVSTWELNRFVLAYSSRTSSGFYSIIPVSIFELASVSLYERVQHSRQNGRV